MHASRFDTLVKTFSTPGTRRALLRLVAALPLAGALDTLLKEESEAGRRKRRKARHDPGDDKDNRKGQRKKKGRRKKKGQHRQPAPAPAPSCVSESRAQTCAGRCGQATNKCGQQVGCGPCACNPTCPICQVCDERTGSCIPDPEAGGDPCATCHTCDGDGQCAAVTDDTPCDDGDACTSNDVCTNGVCGSGDEVVCPANECQIAGTCDAAGGCPDPTNKTNGTGCSNGGICCNGACCSGCCGADGSCGACVVFVTSTTHKGNLGGLSGADAICQQRAQAAGLPGAALAGSYKAWLSDSTNSPSTRFRPSAQPYELVNGTQIADDWADLTDGSLDAKLNITERGGTVADGTFISDGWVWTHTKANATAGGAFNAHCQDWTTSTDTNEREDPNNGDFAAVGPTDSRWSSDPSGGSSCNGNRHLFCFQQE